MKLSFIKLEGCGNDYIYFDCFNQNIDDPASLSVKLSDRNFGVGCDGIILVLPGKKADGKMRIFNADGSEAKMCGNGIRGVAKFIYDNGFSKNNPLSIDTLSGIKEIHLTTDENDKVTEARVDMGMPVLVPALIPTVIEERDCPLEFDDITYVLHPISMGNPHCVIFVDDVDYADVENLGQYLENSYLFPEGVNVEFVQLMEKNTLKIRVWERGSNETLACGTGACASAVVSVMQGYCDMNKDIAVHLPGGTLTIKVTEETVYMTGPINEVFRGEVEA